MGRLKVPIRLEEEKDPIGASIEALMRQIDAPD
jgi:hypothetical protein